MLGFLLPIILLMQGIPVLPNQGGTVTGVLTTEGARPAAGVRVAVMVQPENPADVASAASLVSIAETDDTGRFILENIPPGRYYITAGRVELPTYFPGTLEIAAGRIVTIAAGVTVPGVDFAIKDISDRGVETINAMLRIPMHIQIENGARIPIFSERGKVRLRLTHLTDGAWSEIPLDAPSMTLPVAAGEYQVAVENLPEGYTVNSLNFGAINLLNDTLKVTAGDLPAPAKDERISLTNSQTGIVVQRRNSSQDSYSQSTPQVLMLGSIVSKTDLTLSLATSTFFRPVSGANVGGRIENAGQQEIYISGVRGTLYSDGTFEFHGVPAGRHIVAALGETSTSRQLVAVINVGRSDIEDLELQDTVALPLDVMTPVVKKSEAASESTAQEMHSLRGHLVQESTHHPVGGIVTFQGYGRAATYSLPADGEFEISNLLPGSYGLKIETFESATLTQTIVIEDKDIDLNLSVP
jgi:hypothetical protein